MKFQLTQHTLAGARPENQDRVACVERSDAVLMVLADGLGGYGGGALASATLVETAVRAFQRHPPPPIANPPEFLVLCILHAHRLINARAKGQGSDDPDYSPRTTCVLCLVQDGYAYWAHVGDSRLYHFRGGRLRSRTTDHTTTEMLREDGVLEDGPGRPGNLKSHLLKCVGGSHHPEVTLGEETRLLPGDTLLLCSDGVWEAFEGETLGRYLGGETLEDGIEELLLDAEQHMREACDNLSVIALRWEDRLTTRPPLLGPGTPQVDQAQLRRHPRKRNPEPQAKRPGAAPAERKGAHDAEAIQDAIDELEAFIERLERPAKD